MLQAARDLEERLFMDAVQTLLHMEPDRRVSSQCNHSVQVIIIQDFLVSKVLIIQRSQWKQICVCPLHLLFEVAIPQEDQAIAAGGYQVLAVLSPSNSLYQPLVSKQSAY